MKCRFPRFGFTTIIGGIAAVVVGAVAVFAWIGWTPWS